jgi:hypothetical protein
MARVVMLLGLAVLLLAGCPTTQTGPVAEWGEPYDDIAVPSNYEPHDNPAFKRQDGAQGRRIYGRYSYRSVGDGLDSPERVLEYVKEEMPRLGWELMVEEVDTRRGTMSARFQKDDDQVVLRLEPDRRIQGSDRFSVFTVEMNPQYE